MTDKALENQAIQAFEESENKRPKHGLEKLQKYDDTKKNPFTFLLILIFILVIIMLIVPFYMANVDPNPSVIPDAKEIMPIGIDELVQTHPGLPKERDNYLKLLTPDLAGINLLVVRATEQCGDKEVCQVKAVYYFVRENFAVAEKSTYLQSSYETLSSGGGDAEALAILLANLEASLGVPVRFAFIPGQIYVQIKLDKLSQKYKENDGWTSLDPSCKECGFGELPYSTLNKEKEYLYI